RSARRAAAESRELLADLRRHAEPEPEPDLLTALTALTRAFTSRTGLRADHRRADDATPLPPLPPTTTRHLLSIAAEALENAHRHASATRVEVSARVRGDVLHLRVRDDGRGLPPGITLEGLRALRHAGHFGLLGMAERA